MKELTKNELQRMSIEEIANHLKSLSVEFGCSYEGICYFERITNYVCDERGIDVNEWSEMF